MEPLGSFDRLVPPALGLALGTLAVLAATALLELSRSMAEKYRGRWFAGNGPDRFHAGAAAVIARGVVAGDVDLLVSDVLALEQALGGHAERTGRGRVDFHGFHPAKLRTQKLRDCPPSTTTQAPATQLARGLTRKAMTSPTSSAVPKRSKGISSWTNATVFAGSACSRFSHDPPGWRMLPGASERTRTPRAASSRACSCASAISADLAVL